MKNVIRNILFSLLLVAASVAYAVPAIDVTVADPSGKVAYKGKTGGNGTFATGALQPGEYVVQFNGKANKGTQYALVLSAGKQKVSAESVDGGKFEKGGVAMKIKVGKGMNITGQVSDAQKIAASGNAKMKVVNGRRYFWVSGGTGTNIGGHWVEEGTPEAQNLGRMGQDGMRAIQESGSTITGGN
jgi:hypothetical protein